MRMRGGVIAVLVAVVGFGHAPGTVAHAVDPEPELPVTSTVVGTVTSDLGGDVSGVRVEVLTPGDGGRLLALTSVDAEGRYRVEVAPGRYALRFLDDRARHFPSYQPGGGATRPTGTVEVALGEATRLDVRMRLGARLSGRVLGPGGRLMRDGVHARIEQRTRQGRWVEPEQPYWQPRFIGPDARWWFTPLQPGTYRVRFTASEWFTYVTKPVMLRSGQQVVKNPQMSFGARLTGKVKVRGGGQFAGAVTVHERVRTKSGKVKLKVARSTVFDTDHAGFRLAKLRAGTYVVCGATFDQRRTGCVGGRTPEKAKGIKIRRNQQKNLVLRLR